MARRSKAQRERDLAQISQRYLRGEPQTRIAETLDVSQQTVSNDLKELQRRWQASALVDLNAAKAQELAKIDNLEREYWEAWERSCEDAGTVVKKAKEGGAKEATQTIKGQAGDPRFLTGVQWCIERRCKLLGLDAPIAVDAALNIANTTPLTDEEQAAVEKALIECASASE